MLKKDIAQFHYLTQDNIPNASHVELARQACEGGVKWIQLRIKASPLLHKKELLETAFEVQKICKKNNCILIINDYVDIAKEINADGVHLGKNDMSPSLAREYLGDQYIIGGTAHTFEDILELKNQGVDYIGLGPYQFTTTKQNLSPILGIEGIQSIIKKMKENAIRIPLIAIGGITLSDVKPLIHCGVNGIAVSGAINNATNRADEIKKYSLLFS